MLLLLALLLAVPLHAARASLTKGSLSALAGETRIHVQFDYAGMGIGARNLSEEAYLKSREETYNQKRPGLGTEWANEWRSSKARLFEPAFLEHFNDVVQGLQLGSYPTARYTLVVQTIHIEPGFEAGITGARAWVSLQAKLVETSNPGNIVALISIYRSTANTSLRFLEDRRIMAAYESAGEAIGRLVAKKLS